MVITQLQGNLSMGMQRDVRLVCALCAGRHLNQVLQRCTGRKGRRRGLKDHGLEDACACSADRCGRPNDQCPFNQVDQSIIKDPIITPFRRSFKATFKNHNPSPLTWLCRTTSSSKSFCQRIRAKPYGTTNAVTTRGKRATLSIAHLVVPHHAFLETRLLVTRTATVNAVTH